MIFMNCFLPGCDLPVSGEVQAPSDKLRSSYSV